VLFDAYPHYWTGSFPPRHVGFFLNGKPFKTKKKQQKTISNFLGTSFPLQRLRTPPGSSPKPPFCLESPQKNFLGERRSVSRRAGQCVAARPLRVVFAKKEKNTIGEPNRGEQEHFSLCFRVWSTGSCGVLTRRKRFKETRFRGLMSFREGRRVGGARYVCLWGLRRGYGIFITEQITRRRPKGRGSNKGLLKKRNQNNKGGGSAVWAGRLSSMEKKQRARTERGRAGGDHRGGVGFSGSNSTPKKKVGPTWGGSTGNGARRAVWKREKFEKTAGGEKKGGPLTACARGGQTFQYFYLFSFFSARGFSRNKTKGWGPLLLWTNKKKGGNWDGFPVR